MASVTFDTLKFSKRLEQAGVPAAQAESQAQALAEVLDTNLTELVTKKDLQIALAPIHNDITQLRGELMLVKWMLGFLIAGVLSLVIKAFF